MKIDGVEIIPSTARHFRSIDGECWCVEVHLANPVGNGRMLIDGFHDKASARFAVKRIKEGFRHDLRSESFDRGVAMPVTPMPVRRRRRRTNA